MLVVCLVLCKAIQALAGLAGISLPSGSSESNSKKAIQKINSLSFFENSIYPNIFLPDLMAHDKWSSDTNILSYKDRKYDSNVSKWVENIHIHINKYQVHRKVLKSLRSGILV